MGTAGQQKVDGDTAPASGLAPKPEYERVPVFEAIIEAPIYLDTASSVAERTAAYRHVADMTPDEWFDSLLEDAI